MFGSLGAGEAGELREWDTLVVWCSAVRSGQSLCFACWEDEPSCCSQFCSHCCLIPAPASRLRCSGTAPSPAAVAAGHCPEPGRVWATLLTGPVHLAVSLSELAVDAAYGEQL